VNEVQKIQWKRIFVEAAAIVAGILLAFAIDAWWDERSSQADERAVLSSLLEELHSFENGLQWADRRAEGIRLSAQRLLNAAVGPGDSLPDQEIDRLIGDLSWYITPANLITPILDSLGSGAAISAISSSDLRIKIIVVSSQIEYVRLINQTDMSFFQTQLIPFLMKHTAWQQIYNVSNQEPGTGGEFPGEIVELRALISHQDLLSNREFQNLLTQRIALLTEFEKVRPAQIQTDLEELIEMVVHELEN